MQRIKLLTLGLVVSLVAAAGVAGVASATWSPNFKSSNETVTLAADETHQGSLYATGSEVIVDGTVTGSLYCAGQDITINGTVQGDVLCAGQNVTLNGAVEGDVRVAGQFIRGEGTVAGSFTAFAQSVRMSDDSTIGADLNGAAQQFTVDGEVGRDIALGAQTLTLNGQVAGNVDAGVEQLRLGNDSSVAGNLNYSANKQLSIDESAVAGEVSYNPVESDGRSDGRQFIGAFKLVFLLMTILTALVIVLLMPRFVNRSSDIFRRQMLMTILIGFSFMIGAPIVAIMMMISVILAPLGLVLMAGWFVVMILSSAFFAYYIGAELLREQRNTIVRMMGGVLILAIAYMIPLLNSLALFIATVVGSGMFIMTLTNGYKRPDYNVSSKAKAKAAK